MSEPAFAIVNPESAAGLTGRRWTGLRPQVEAAVGHLRWAFSEAPGHATALAHKAVLEGHGRVIAVGGDGTLGEVTTGLLAARAAGGREAALGLLPMGTGSDFARTLGIASPAAAIAALAKGGRRRIDLGRVAYTGHDGQQHERLFVNVLSFGCSGAISSTLSRSTKLLGGRLGFMLGTARALLSYRDQPVSVSLDGAPPETYALTNFALCNGRFFGGGMQVAPRAELDDGLFDVTIWRGFGFADFALKKPMLYDGRHVRLPGTSTARATTLEATSDVSVLIDVDGEPLGRLPLSARLLPSALELLV